MTARKKYKLLKSDKCSFSGKPLYQIQAVVSFEMIVKGEKGGFIEKESNLSHNGTAWVSRTAQVFDNAWVSGNARVSGQISLSTSCDQVFPRIEIDTKKKLDEVIQFLKKYEE